jgi:hypothetical protein
MHQKGLVMKLLVPTSLMNKHDFYKHVFLTNKVIFKDSQQKHEIGEVTNIWFNAH